MQKLTSRIRVAPLLPTFICGLPAAVFGTTRTFEADGEQHRYFHHRYLYTWLNERTVEIPLALAELENANGGSVLEVGNVLAHYGRRGHDVVDRYERANGVRNIDVLTLPDGETWDLIISVSTLEHVGVDDTPKHPERAIEALRLLASRLRPGGRLLATVPIGYNQTLDHALADGVPGFNVTAMRRTAPGPNWCQASPSEISGLSYDDVAKSARGLLIVRSAA